MEKLAQKLAHRIAQNLGYDPEREAVIAYGLIAMIQVSVTVLLVFLLGLLAGVPVESLIVCFSASILRKYSGGAHAETAELCSAISAVYCTATAVLAKTILTVLYHPIFMSIVSVAIYGISFLLIARFAPVDSPNKPIRTEKKRKRMRKGSFITMTVYVALSALLFALSSSYDFGKSYAISMLFGISWQVFTLTTLGSRFIGKMNAIFILRKGVLR